MPLELTDEEWLARLDARRKDRLKDIERYWSYYDNQQPLMYVAKILEEQGDRFPPLRVNWPALVVDSLEERLDIEGFLLGDGDEPDDDLTAIWQGNDLDEFSGEGHISALVAQNSFIWIGPGIEDDLPKVTVEYPDQVAVETDPATGRVIAAIKVWAVDENASSEEMASVQLPGGRIVTFEKGKKVDEAGQSWAKALEQHQTSPLVPVVPMLNRPRRGRGRSELDNIIPLADAVNQTATNMLAAIEHHALPRRWAVNLAEQDFQDDQGKPLPAWKIATGAVWAIPRADDDTGVLGEQAQPRVGQFTGADLNNFHGSIRQLATLAASLYGLPPHYLGYASDNPASADAIRSAEARLVKRAERRQRTFGGAWERAMRIALAVMGRDPAEANRLETVWRNAATPTKAAAFDAAVKGVQSGLIDVEQAREDVGYSAGQRARMRARSTGETAQVSNIVTGMRNLDRTGGVGITPPPALPGGLGAPADPGL